MKKRGVRKKNEMKEKGREREREKKKKKGRKRKKQVKETHIVLDGLLDSGEKQDRGKGGDGIVLPGGGKVCRGDLDEGDDEEVEVCLVEENGKGNRRGKKGSAMKNGQEKCDRVPGSSGKKKKVHERGSWIHQKKKGGGFSRG
jgi:hypothetical protein